MLRVSICGAADTLMHGGGVRVVYYNARISVGVLISAYLRWFRGDERVDEASGREEEKNLH